MRDDVLGCFFWIARIEGGRGRDFRVNVDVFAKTMSEICNELAGANISVHLVELIKTGLFIHAFLWARKKKK